MALIKCPECGKEISDKAAFCPHCGYPIREYATSGNKSDTQNSENRGASDNIQAEKSSAEINQENDDVKSLYSVRKNFPKDSSKTVVKKTTGEKRPSKQQKARGTCVTILIVLAIIVIFAVAAASFADKADEKNAGDNNSGSSDSVAVTVGNNTEPASSSAEDEKEDGKKQNTKDLAIGDHVTVDGTTYSLLGVKTADTLYTEAGDEKDNIASGNQVLYAYYYAENLKDKTESVDFSDLASCSVDGVQADGVDTYFVVSTDGVTNTLSPELAPHLGKVQVVDYEIPKDFTEIKIDLQGKCNYLLGKDDCTTDTFAYNGEKPDTSVYDLTEPGSSFEDSNGCTWKLDNFEIHTEKNSVWGDEDYAVFEYGVTNNGDSSADFSLVGYEMSAYQNGLEMKDADYMLDKINGYTNVFSVENIGSGNTQKLYVAFEMNRFDSDYSDFIGLVDTGYIVNKALGTVHIKK